MAPWRHGRIYLGGRWHEPSARALKLSARDNSAYLARWAAVLAHEQVRGRKTKRGIKISRRVIKSEPVRGIKSGVTSLTVPSIGTVEAGSGINLRRSPHRSIRR
jgi:hypothetical protein